MRSTDDDQDEPYEMRQVAGPMARAITEATVGADRRDRALIELALRYANDIQGCSRCLDCGGPRMADVVKLGPALLAALEALQLSPRARKVIKDVGPAVSDLDNELDRRRRSRRGRPEGVDPAAP